MTEVEKFTDDPIQEAAVRALITERGVQTVVETGTWMGGSARAMAGMAKQVVTIEFNPEFFSQAQGILAPLPNVKQYLGRSELLLPEILKTVTPPTLYYLDAHWPGDHPLPQEIDIIAEVDPSPVLVIHDMQVPDRPGLKFDLQPNGCPYSFEWIKPNLAKIKRPWRHYYNTEAGGRKVGVLFVVPA